MANRGLQAALFVAAGVLLAVIVTALAGGMARSAAGPAREQAPAAAPPKPVAVDAGAVRMLAILQQEGRLLDFLLENIAGFDDRQIGAAVRTIHEACRKALAEHMDIEPVVKEQEGEEIKVEPGFDPSAIRLTGNVAGAPPFRGFVRHSGWRAAATRMPERLGQPEIIEPAEVEVP